MACFSCHFKTAKHDELVFPNSDGGYYTEIPHPFREAMHGTELKFNDGVQDHRQQRAMFHSLRHTFGSWHAEAGTNFYVLKALMGHGSITLTERYSRLSQGTLKTAIKNIEQTSSRQQAGQVVPFTKSADKFRCKFLCQVFIDM